MGSTGDIILSLKDAPKGFKLGGAKVQAKEDKVKLTITAPSEPTKDPVNLKLEGRATIAGREVVHAAVPAQDMMQAFEYRHLVPSQELDVAVMGRILLEGGLGKNPRRHARKNPPSVALLRFVLPPPPARLERRRIWP